MSNIIPQTEAQVRFDKAYITASEIMRELDIQRSSFLHLRRSGKLPDPIVVNEGRLFIWEREVVRPYLDAYKMMHKIKSV
jgi:hypothetical protein